MAANMAKSAGSGVHAHFDLASSPGCALLCSLQRSRQSHGSARGLCFCYGANQPRWVCFLYQLLTFTWYRAVHVGHFVLNQCPMQEDDSMSVLPRMRFMAHVSAPCHSVTWPGWLQTKEKLIDASRHHVLKAPHPSPLAGASGHVFVGCRHFSKANKLLAAQPGSTPIDWALPE